MSATDRLKDAIKWGTPDPILFSVSSKFFRLYSHVMTWYASGRHYSAPIDPCELVYIDPLLITKVITPKGQEWFNYSDVVSEVINGDWDKHVWNLEEYDLYNAFFHRFQHQRPWHETDFYDRAKDLFENGGEKWGCENIRQFENRLEKMDQLFKSISSNGYKTQAELRQSPETDPALRRIHRFLPPEFHEVSIAISRDGQLIIYEGRHRLTIAQILELDQIPIRIKGRHKEWQLQRDRYMAEKKCQDIDPQHPDIRTL